MNALFVQGERFGVVLANSPNLRVEDLRLFEPARCLASSASGGASNPPLPKKRPTLRTEMLLRCPV